jgi:hypothetical protein
LRVGEKELHADDILEAGADAVKRDAVAERLFINGLDADVADGFYRGLMGAGKHLLYWLKN